MKASHTLVSGILLLAVTASSLPASGAWAEVRQLVLKSDQVTGKRQKEKLLRDAYSRATTSVQRSPAVSNEHLWLANAAGRLAQIASSKEKIQLAKVVKESAERAIALDPRNGPAYMTLGAWHHYVANVGWLERAAAKALFGELPEASHETAIDLLTKALRHGAENRVEILFLRGRAHRELDHEASAEADFRACIAAPPANAYERSLQEKVRKRLGG